MMSLSSQKKAESDLLIISNLLSSFIAYTLLVALCLTCKREAILTHYFKTIFYNGRFQRQNKKTKKNKGACCCSYQLYLSKRTPADNFDHLIVFCLHPQISNFVYGFFVCGKQDILLTIVLPHKGQF